jgi:putative membrane protein
MTDRKDPLIIELDAHPLPDAPSPAEAAQPMDQPVATERMLTAAAAPRGTGLGGWILWAVGAFVMLWLGVAVTDFVTALFDRHQWLGWAGSGLLGLMALLLVFLCLRELAALSRLGRIEKLRGAADEARETGSGQPVDAVLRGLRGLYKSRRDLEWARDNLAKGLADTPDPLGRLDLAERTMMAPLDEQAATIIQQSARNVAAATALIPLAMVDVLAALTQNLRMIRQISEIYGGRAGWLGSWRLMKAVAAHLVATGAVAVADDLLGPLVGGGVLGKLSRRFGEGAVNGALTARVGVSAMEICRPMPFAVLEKPKASGLLLGALKAWRTDGKNS